MQCRKVHHYGIAWTPGDNEQRVGRVDRLFGLVNRQLELNGRSELSIHYPYLEKSFDEDQLAAFIREKHRVEIKIDACQQPTTSSEIDLRNGTESWKSYLRQPTISALRPVVIDPFPYDPTEKPANSYQPRSGDGSL